jgi:hypothetical protein
VNSVLKASALASLLAILLAMTGCASTSTFTAYPTKIEPFIKLVANRTPIDLSGCLPGERTSNDLILYNMECGRIAQIVGDSDISMSDFNVSIEKIRTNDEKAIISASGVGANLAATLLNDNAIPYESDGYERVLLHHYQALNYLKKKNIEGAGVEVRRANAEQNESLKRFEKELDKSREDAAKKRVNSQTAARVDSRYAQMDEADGKVKNSFQNAYTFYVSGFIDELLQQPNDAYIDYKKALEIYPGNKYLQNDVLRLAAKLDMREELDELKLRFPNTEQQSGTGTAVATGELLVLFEDGFVPQKHEIIIPIPVGGYGLVSLAFPIYPGKLSGQLPLQIYNNSTLLGTTELICDIRALAVKALKEKAPVIATRQIIRAVAKGAMALESKKLLGGLGQIALSAWNLVSESADLRSWLTLPANAQILRIPLPVGHHKLSLQHPMATGPTFVDVDIAANSKIVLQVIRPGRHIYSSVTSL